MDALPGGRPLLPSLPLRPGRAGRRLRSPRGAAPPLPAPALPPPHLTGRAAAAGPSRPVPPPPGHGAAAATAAAGAGAGLRRRRQVPVPAGPAAQPAPRPAARVSAAGGRISGCAPPRGKNFFSLIFAQISVGSGGPAAAGSSVALSPITGHRPVLCAGAEAPASPGPATSSSAQHSGKTPAVAFFLR